jgi:hypothetical protein
MKSNIISTLIVFLFIVTNIFLRIFPYLFYEYDFLIGFDSGKYQSELVDKISVSPETVDLWVEPGLNTNLYALILLTNISASDIYRYVLPILFSITFVIMIFLISKRYSNTNIGYISSLVFFTTSPILLNSTFDSFYRQILASLLFMAFLYIVEPIYQSLKIQRSTILLLSIMGAGIIFTHRAISLLYVLSLGVLFIRFFIYQRSGCFKIILIGFGSILLSLPYLLQILQENILVVRDTIQMSVQGTAGGERVIKTLSREDNQIVGYIKNYDLSAVFIILSVILSLYKRQIYFVTLIMLLLIVYILGKATFSNRYIFNLELIFVISIGFIFTYLGQVLQRKLVLLFLIVYFLITCMTTIQISNTRKPYVPYRTESISWVENNINPNNSIIVAPAPLATIFTSMGYSTSIYEIPLKVGQKDQRIPQTEEILLYGHQDLRHLHNLTNTTDNVYIIFGEWYLYNPLSRIEQNISLSDWEQSSYFEKIYEGDGYIYRIYKLKTS